mmetsp:Transcript_15299/g.36141  ORF Transcript_15299/g.36141 Transcript_15299/m.36141 type:complete len:302 (+) Transcript_15299:21-926(+)
MGAALVAGASPCGIGIGGHFVEAAMANGARSLHQFRRLSLNFCLEDHQKCGIGAEGCCADGRLHETIACDGPDQFESLMQELFRVHDLNENGLLEELELIQLNKKIAMLHYGKDIDLAAITLKYRDLYRTGLDPEGQPVPYPTFRKYMMKVLSEIDPDVGAQEMVMEQFINEAVLARSAFHFPSTASVSDLPFLSKIRVDDWDLLQALRWDRGLLVEEAEHGDMYVFRTPSGIGMERMLSTASATLSKPSPSSRMQLEFEGDGSPVSVDMPVPDSELANGRSPMSCEGFLSSIDCPVRGVS